MSQRRARFEALRNHPMIGKDFKKLTAVELKMCVDFITSTDDLTDNEYANKVNRYLLDQPKPKHYNQMWALLSQSIAPQQRKARA